MLSGNMCEKITIKKFCNGPDLSPEEFFSGEVFRKPEQKMREVLHQSPRTSRRTVRVARVFLIQKKPPPKQLSGFGEGPDIGMIPE